MYNDIKTKVLKSISDLEIIINGEENPLDSINSIGFIKLVVAIENEFGIEFNDEDLISDTFKDVHSLVIYIQEKLVSSEDSYKD